MNILIAPDSFKGSLSAAQFCDISAGAIKSIFPNANITKIPMADGGEGTVETLVHNTSGEIKYKTVTGPTEEPVKAHFGILGDKKTAIIEMASASGLPLVPEDKRNPLVTTTYGTGELVKEAMDLGCRKIIMGIGGSATNDGGAGMARALGYKLLDNSGNPISSGGNGLLELESIDSSDKDCRLEQTQFQVACDVDNPLLGPNGASNVYGPQKGADEEKVQQLESALTKLDQVIKKDLNKSVADVPGAGAAGGLGAGMIAFCNADLKPGFEIVKDILNLDKIFQSEKFDLVITGEGETNYQTVNGKLPVGIGKLGKQYHVPVLLVAGSLGKDAEKVLNHGIDTIVSIMNKPMTLQTAIDNAESFLFQTISQQMRFLKACSSIRDCRLSGCDG